MSDAPNDLSILVLLRGGADLPALWARLSERLESLERKNEVLFLIGVDDPALIAQAREIFQREPERVRVLQFAAGASDSAMLSAGKDRARGEVLVTLPGPLETDLAELGSLLEAVEHGSDLAVASRAAGRSDGAARAQSRLFNRLISWAAGARFQDVASGTRAIRRQVLDEIPLYGDYHRYLPLLAERLGFAVVEIPASLPAGVRRRAVHHPGVYFARALDILSVVFVSRFTRYPLRLFGGVGSLFALAGGVLLTVIGIQRILGQSLANRPVLVLATLLLGLGVQAFTIGLLGELILFFQARNVRDYRILAVWDASAPSLDQAGAAGPPDQNKV